MHVHASKSGQVQDLFAQDLAKSRHHDQVRRLLAKPLDCLRALDPDGGEYRNSPFVSALVDRRLDHTAAAALGPVGLCHRQADFAPASHHCIQYFCRQIRRSHKYDLQLLSPLALMPVSLFAGFFRLCFRGFLRDHLIQLLIGVEFAFH